MTFYLHRRPSFEKRPASQRKFHNTHEGANPVWPELVTTRGRTTRRVTREKNKKITERQLKSRGELGKLSGLAERLWVGRHFDINMNHLPLGQV